jgi:mRNA interferase MazF
LVTVALQGDYGKPRPALIIQGDYFNAHPSFTVLPITSELREGPQFRVSIEPNDRNGLRMSSQVMVDKAQTVPSEKIGSVIGNLDNREMQDVSRALSVFLGIA